MTMTMTQTQTYRCGHAGDVPANMGRGIARAKRLDLQFGRKCPACRAVSLRAQAAGLCVLLPGIDGRGLRNVRRYNEDEIEAYVARHN